MAKQQVDGLTQTIDLILSASDERHYSVGQVLDTTKGRGFGPLLLIPALVTFLPTGGIPGVPIVAAIIIVLAASQLLMGRESPWLPQRIRQLQIKKSSLSQVLTPAKKYTARVDRVLKPRLVFLVGSGGLRFVACLCIVLAIALIPLGPIPFAAAAPSGILVLLSLGIVVKDGALVLIGTLLTTATSLLVLF